MQRALRLGFLAPLGLVLGCAMAAPTAQDDLNEGEGDPKGTADPVVKKAPLPSSPAPTGDGSPVPYPNQVGSPVTPAPVKEKSKMTFFVTSAGSAALGGNLGGLVGADKKCQDLATAVTAGDHTWHAYLSVAGTNARDRIGAGPWTNQKGVVIAANVEALHDFQLIPPNSAVLDEKGIEVPKTATAILTGTKADGTALLDTCQDWTSNTAQQTGHVGEAASQTSVILGARWNDARTSYGCAQAQILANKGEGRLYCFAID